MCVSRHRNSRESHLATTVRQVIRYDCCRFHYTYFVRQEGIHHSRPFVCPVAFRHKRSYAINPVRCSNHWDLSMGTDTWRITPSPQSLLVVQDWQSIAVMLSGNCVVSTGVISSKASFISYEVKVNRMPILISSTSVKSNLINDLPHNHNDLDS